MDLFHIGIYFFVISPGTGYEYYICNVAQSGMVNSGNLIGYIDSSYGI